MKCPHKFYVHCPDCRQRMRRVVMEGDDIYSLEIGYSCPCGREWTYSPYRNGLHRGLPATQEEETEGVSA